MKIIRFMIYLLTRLIIVPSIIVLVLYLIYKAVISIYNFMKSDLAAEIMAGTTLGVAGIIGIVVVVFVLRLMYEAWDRNQ